jgi:SAM-dependent methyltransferase
MVRAGWYDAVMLGAFIAANHRVAASIKPHIPHARPKPFDLFDRRVAELTMAPGTRLVADIGGGRACPFAAMAMPRSARIVAVDIDPGELARNQDVDETRVADAAGRLPFADGEVDLLVSKTVLEHLRDNAAFVHESARVLAAGGRAVHLVPGRWAPFAFGHRLLGFERGQRLHRAIRPQAEATAHFPAYYDRCTHGALAKLHRRAGFASVTVRPYYYQADYFGGFLPAYLGVVAYETALAALGVETLAAYYLVEAVR